MKEFKLSSNMEDYLEVIALIKKESGVARVSDIARAMGVKKPSVNAALRSLSQKGLVAHERYGYVDLTEDGERIARQVQARHDILGKFFTDVLGIEADIAKEDACKIEHIMSAATFKRLTKFIGFMEDPSIHKEGDGMKKFRDYLKKNKNI